MHILARSSRDISGNYRRIGGMDAFDDPAGRGKQAHQKGRKPIQKGSPNRWDDPGLKKGLKKTYFLSTFFIVKEAENFVNA